MPPRALAIFDLPKLARHRNAAIALDSLRVLTRGNPLRAINFLAHLNLTKRIYTGITENADGAILGGLIQREEENFARLTYLAPSKTLTDGWDFVPLIEHLAAQAGKWQTHQILAEIEENSPLFQSLRQSGFAVCSRQRIWDLSAVIPAPNLPPRWRKQRSEDMIAIRSLQRQIVPPLLQQTEAFGRSTDGLLYHADELLAYVDVAYGPRGIFLRPLIHPNIENVREKLLLLLTQLSNRRERPVYVCVRSYQAWIESMLEEIGASVGPRQVVMVKHLVNLIREEKTLPANADTAWANPAASIKQGAKTVE
ncbi:MAG: hypothetical protein L3J16_04560 [Anaerolineales bacterium]|nr:hypothetical protein [Anaerolineales bacterium]